MEQNAVNGRADDGVVGDGDVVGGVINVDACAEERLEEGSHAVGVACGCQNDVVLDGDIVCVGGGEVATPVDGDAAVVAFGVARLLDTVVLNDAVAAELLDATAARSF